MFIVVREILPEFTTPLTTFYPCQVHSLRHAQVSGRETLAIEVIERMKIKRRTEVTIVTHEITSLRIQNDDADADAVADDPYRCQTLPSRSNDSNSDRDNEGEIRVNSVSDLRKTDSSADQNKQEK